MKSILTALAFAVIFTSCQKEISFDTGNGNNPGGAGSGNGSGTGSTSGLLVKTVAVTGSETQTTLYTYDAQKRLETITLSGTSGGMSVNSYQKFIRDAAGRIVKVLQKLPDQAGSGATSDTAVKTYHYPDATTMNYDYSISLVSITTMGFTMATLDSAVYTYNGGKMLSFTSFMSSSIMPGTVMMNTRYDFGYDVSNRVTSMKVYNDANNPGGALDLTAQSTYTYSSATVNNVYASASGAQNFALNGLPNTTANIITKTTTSSVNSTPSIDVTITMTYATDSSNKPVSGTSVAVTTGQPTQNTRYTFYYQ